MLPDERRAKTLVVVQGLTRRAVRCPYFSLYLGREKAYGPYDEGVIACLGQ
jgi:hypothetical protein